MLIQPNQKISTKEKLEGTGVPLWIKQNCDYFSNQMQDATKLNIELASLYKLADGELEPEDYEYITNPFKSKIEEFTRYPAKLRNYDIITPILDRFLGERRSRPNRTNVVVANRELVNEYKEELHEKYKEILTGMALRELAQKGIPVEAPEAEMELKEVENKALLSWNERLAKQGQHAINFIAQSCSLQEQYQQGFYDWLVTGRVASCKMNHHDDVSYKIISPLQLTVYGWDESSKYAEDALAIKRTVRWNSATIIDTFREYLKDEDIEWIKKLENRQITAADFKVSNTNWIRTDGGVFMQNDDGAIEVEHFVWKSLTKRGILTYIDGLGTTVQQLVDETYKLNKAAGDIKIEWSWENEWWEAWRIVNPNFTGSADVTNQNALYIKWGVGEVQRTEINNTSVCKLPYNMTFYGHRYNSVKSIVKLGIPYQILYNNFHYQFEKMMGKNKDKLLLFPIGLIPKMKGWDTERWMYSINAFSIAFFDEQSERAATAIQAMKEIDMSLGKFMQDMWVFMNNIKNEWWDAVGFNRQRYGDTFASDGKGATEQAIFRSAIANRELIEQYERFREKEAEGLIDYSKYAWIEGKQGSYINEDGMIEMFQIAGIDHANSEYGVFVNNSVGESDKLDFIKQTIIQPLAQNGVAAEILFGLVDTDNLSQAKELAKRGDQLLQEFQQRQAQSQQEADKAIAEANLQMEQAKLENARYIADQRNKTAIETALITADSFNAVNEDANDNGIMDSQDIADRSHKRQIEAQKLQETQRANIARENLQRQKLANDAKKIASKK